MGNVEKNYWFLSNTLGIWKEYAQDVLEIYMVPNLSQTIIYVCSYKLLVSQIISIYCVRDAWILTFEKSQI